MILINSKETLYIFFTSFVKIWIVKEKDIFIFIFVFTTYLKHIRRSI